MTHWLVRKALAALLVWCFAPNAGAQSDTITGVATPIVSTHHSITVAGKPLSYTARAGLLPIRHNDDGSVRAHIFFVAYTADHLPNEPQRPITFLWNGGPGANSLLVHLSAFGPRRLDEGDSPVVASRPPRFVDNQETLLTQTDLVFVDPVGSGFSRPARPEYAPDFYGVREDIAATREFIRTYRAHFDAWDAPVYLAGESYGTWRAAGTAAAMAANGEHVSGVILISGGIPVGPIASPEMRAALFLPTRLATAAYHHRLAPELERDTVRAMREAEDWGRTVYAPALAKRETLSSADRSAIRVRLARYTGLDTSAIDQKTLIVDGGTVQHDLLGGQGLLERLDTRQIMHAESADDRTRERARRALINGYLRNDLGFKTDLVYQGLEDGWSASGTPRNVNAEWKWDQGEPGAPVMPVDDGPPGGTPPWVQRTFAANHTTRTFVAAGVYDALNSCPLIKYQISRLEPALRDRISTGCYVGGHMMYLDRDARVSLRRDLAHFYDAALR